MKTKKARCDDPGGEACEDGKLCTHKLMKDGKPLRECVADNATNKKGNTILVLANGSKIVGKKEDLIALQKTLGGAIEGEAKAASPKEKSKAKPKTPSPKPKTKAPSPKPKKIEIDEEPKSAGLLPPPKLPGDGNIGLSNDEIWKTFEKCLQNIK